MEYIFILFGLMVTAAGGAVVYLLVRKAKAKRDR